MNPDYIIKNARVYQTFRHCFEQRDVAVAGERFYSVSPALSYPGIETIDAQGCYMIPGLIDIHMHIESSMTYPAEFSRITLPYGVTTLVADAHEIANVFGMEGLRAFMEGETPQDIYWAIPSSVPATDDAHETAGAALNVDDVRMLAQNTTVRCLGEIMNYKDLSAEGESRTRQMIAACLAADRGMRIEGHCPALTGADLNRFIYEGVDADHTQQTPASILEKSELGMFLELQRKSLTPEVVRTVCDNQLYENVALITDDTMADHLLEEQLNGIVECAIEAGMPAEMAIYCATYTPARRMHLDDRGMIAPGKLADFCLLDDLTQIRPVAVYKRGRRVEPAADTVAAASFPEAFYHSVHCRAAVREDFVLRAEEGDADWADVNVIKIGTFGTATTPVTRRVAIRDGALCWQEAGLSLAVVYERHGRNGNIAQGLVEGAMQQPGAVATTWSHDSHNLLVLGTDPDDMVRAQRRVLELQGGYVVSAGGEITGEARLSIAGILSDAPMEVLGADLRKVRAAMEALGYVNNNVIMSMSTLCLPVSPRLKLTDYGLLAVPSQEWVPLVAGYGRDQ